MSTCKYVRQDVHQPLSSGALLGRGVRGLEGQGLGLYGIAEIWGLGLRDLRLPSPGFFRGSKV